MLITNAKYGYTSFYNEGAPNRGPLKTLELYFSQVSVRCAHESLYHPPRPSDHAKDDGQLVDVAPGHVVLRIKIDKIIISVSLSLMIIIVFLS